MTQATKWIVAVSFLLAAAGFLFPFWPLSVLGVVVLALSGRWVFALGVGLLLDLAYGAPLGGLRTLYVPFFMLACVLSVVQHWAAKYFLNKNLPDTLE